MFEKIIVFGLFEKIQKKKSEDRVPRYDLQAGSGTAARAITSPLLTLKKRVQEKKLRENERRAAWLKVK